MLAALCVVAAVGPLVMARCAAASELPLVVLPCAPSSRGPLVLLGRRVFVQGTSTSTPSVPAWAGQWTPVTGSPELTTTSVITLALRLFAAQTGQTIPGASGAIVRADTSDAEVAKIVIVPTSEAALTQLAAAAEQAIAAGSASQDVFAEVAVLPTVEAVERLGPVAVPPGGWAPWVIENVYGGAAPSALDVAFPLLVNLLAARSMQPATLFQQAFLGVGAACGGAPAG